MKSIFSSKTIWFNVLTGIVTVAAAFGYVPNGTIQAQMSGYIIILAPVINIILRLLTNTSVTFVKPESE